MLTEHLHNESYLLEQLKDSSEEAFTLLYKHYSPQLYLNVLRMVRDASSAKEIVQEAFTRIWQKRTAAGVRENFSGYLFRIALNLVHDFFRKLKRESQLMQNFKNSFEEGYKHIEEEVQDREASARIIRAIEQLSPQQKKAYQLVREEGFTYKKAADIMNISPLTVKEYLSSTRKAIRRYLLQHADDRIFFFIIILLFFKS